MYWFITEDESMLGSWKLESYNNSKVTTPASVSNSTYTKMKWYKEATANNNAAKNLITKESKSVYMSVFENKGGVINNNIPSDPIKPQKQAPDTGVISNKYIWLAALLTADIILGGMYISKRKLRKSN